MKTETTAQSSDTETRVAKGSIWVEQTYKTFLVVRLAAEANVDGFIEGPRFEVCRETGDFISATKDGVASADACQRIWPPADVNQDLLAALKAVEALFRDGSPFYISKLGAPMTNGDQEVIDRAFVASSTAIAKAEGRQ